jgi:site-specific recombinase XerD
MKEYDEWLNEQSEGTREHYVKRINSFLSSMGQTIEEFSKLSNKEMKHLVLEYRAKSEKEGMPQNTILSRICSVRSFCAYIEKPLVFKQNQLGKVQADTDSHIFSNGDLKGLFEIGNTFEKALIASSVSLGWEISSVLNLERDKVRAKIEHAKQNSETFIFFEDTRNKTGESRFAVLNPLAIEWLTKYFEVSDEEIKKRRENRNDKKFTEGKTEKDLKIYDEGTENMERCLFPISEDGVNKMLKRLASASGLKLTGSIRFHNIRKWLMSRLSRCGFNEFQIKYVMGKAIGVSDRTYLQTLQTDIEEKYPRIYNEYLNIVPTVSLAEKSKELEQLQKEISQLKEQNELYKNILRDLVKDKTTTEIVKIRYSDDKEVPALPEEKTRWTSYLKKLKT